MRRLAHVEMRESMVPLPYTADEPRVGPGLRAQMQQQVERHEPQHQQPHAKRFGRLLRNLVADPRASNPAEDLAAQPADPLVDVLEDDAHLRALEARVSELERGMHVLAETLRRSHGELARSIQSLGVIARDDRVSRAEVQALVREAMGSSEEAGDG